MPNRAARPDLITAGTYPFTSASGVALEDMSSGTTQLVGPSQDDTASPFTNIGFDYWYDGVRTSQFSVNANGLLRLGPTVSGRASPTGRAYEFTQCAQDCSVLGGPLHRKHRQGALQGRRQRTRSQARGRVAEHEGHAERGCVAPVGTGTFQAWLHESADSTSPGRIEFVYGAFPAPAVSTPDTPSVCNPARPRTSPALRLSAPRFPTRRRTTPRWTPSGPARPTSSRRTSQRLPRT